MLTNQNVFYLPDKPGEPEGPLSVSDVFADNCKLSWKPPTDNGGSEVTGTKKYKKLFSDFCLFIFYLLCLEIEREFYPFYSFLKKNKILK